MYKIKENRDTKNTVDPTQFTVSNALNSLWRVNIVSLQPRDHREGEAQYKYGMNKRPKRVDTQLSEKLKSLEEGSKIENKLAIIFR